MTDDEAPTTAPIHVNDPGYDPGPPQAPLVSSSLPPEDLVERAVSRAADKVATAAPLPQGLSRLEGFALAGALIILNLAALFVGLQTRAEQSGHRADFREVCQLIVERTPADDVTAIGRRLAECLR